MKPNYLKFLLYLAIAFVVAGCGGSSHSTSPIAVAITGAPSTVTVGTTATLGVTVTNDAANAGVTWGVTGGGTFTSTTSSLVYTAPATVPSPATVTVTATSITDTTKSSMVTFTIVAAPVIAVTITGAPSTVTVSTMATLGVTVTNDAANAGVTWGVTGGGTFTSTPTSLVYTAPATVPASATVTVTATSITDTTKSNSVTFSIVSASALSVHITNPLNSIAAGAAAVTINATVANDGSTPGVTWSVVTTNTSTNCQPGCGTLTGATTTSVVYTPPATVPSSPNATILATSNSDTTKYGENTFTITGSSSNLQFLSGPYAFALSGFDGTGNALTLAGVFTADGNGNINSGEVDVNDNGSNTVITSGITGTYTVDDNLHGIITFATAFPAFSNTPGFSFTIDSTTHSGGMISLDQASPNAAVSGSLIAQLSTSIPTGSYVLRLASDVPQRLGVVGEFTVGAGGAISSGLVDSADIINGNDSVDTSLTGTFSTPDASGRGTISFSPGGNFAYFVVSSNQVFLIETDENTQAIGLARSQNLSAITSSTVNVTDVFGIIGGDFDPTEEDQFASVAAGQLVISGGSTAGVACDLNDAGGLNVCSGNTPQTPFPGTVTFDPTTGRGTVTMAGGFDQGFIDSFVFYMASDGSGVMLDTTGNGDASSSDSYPEALVGDLVPQTATAAVAGTVQGVDEISAEVDIPVVDSVDTLSSDNINGFTDGSLAGSGTLSDQALTGTVSAIDSTGRGSGTVTSAVYGTNLPFALYAASPTQYFVVGEASDSTSSLGVFTSQTIPESAAAVRTRTSSAASGRPFAKPKGRKAATKTRAHARTSK